jgi:hypothetical protein
MKDGRRQFGWLIGVLCAALALWVFPRSSFISGFFQRVYPGVVPSSDWARNLNSSDTDLVRESLYFLTKRKNPVAVFRAIELLTHPDDYVWLNAALYLGACNRQEAVPHLIKALRHTAHRADVETAQYLRTLTGADFGTDFARWQQWWLTGHPDTPFDWDSHLGHAPRLTEGPKQ